MRIIEDDKKEELNDDYYYTLFVKIRNVSRNLISKKEMTLKSYLGLEKKEDWNLILETPYDWAVDKIKEFQINNGLHECEVISVNNMVFVFSRFEFNPLVFGESSGTYKYEVKQNWAVFKKSEVVGERV